MNQKPSPEPAEESSPEAPDERCDYCRQTIPGEAITVDTEGGTYHFCSDPCRETMFEEGRVFSEYHGFRQFDPGVSALREGLPKGVPRNSFVLISSEPGTREEALQGEIVWRALQRGEPAVIVTFLDTPVSVVQTFVGLGWNVLPYLHSGQLRILDCFTYRLDDPEANARGMSDWNRHLHDVAMESTERVRDPSNPQAVINGIENCLDEMADEMNGERADEEGVVVIDSLTEFGSLVQPVQAYDFVKDLRARVCKARTVPVFAGGSRASDDDFPHDLGYITDGVIDIALTEQVVEDTLMKRIRIRKMSGVRSIGEWTTYEFAEGEGLFEVDVDDDDDADDGANEGDDANEDGKEDQSTVDEEAETTPDDSEDEPEDSTPDTETADEEDTDPGVDEEAPDESDR